MNTFFINDILNSDTIEKIKSIYGVQILFINNLFKVNINKEFKPPLYLLFHKNKITLSNNIDCMINYLSLDLNKVQKYLKENLERHDTIFKNLITLIPFSTYYISYKNDILITKRLINIETPKKNISFHEYQDILVKSLDKITKKEDNFKKNAAIFFSSGLDSSSILFSLNSFFDKEKICAITWHSETDDDLLNAQKICKELSIKHILIKIKHDSLFKKIKSNLPAYPYIPILFRNVMDISRERIASIYGKNNVFFLNGHGGDHIFLEHMPKSIIYYLFKKKKFKNLFQFMENQDMSYFNLAYHIFLSIFFSEKKALCDHIDAIDMAISDNIYPLFSSLDTKIEFPFTQKEVIEASMKIPYENLFNRELSRYFPRVALYELFKNDIFFRKEKSVNTDIFQKNLYHQYDYIENIIKNGVISKNKLIDPKNILISLKKNSLGLGGFDKHLANIIAAELLIQSFMEMKNETF